MGIIDFCCILCNQLQKSCCSEEKINNFVKNSFMEKSNNYCVIMAGGIGSRFWPLITSEKPKQFLDIFGIGRTLLQLTYDRFVKILPNENFLVVTSESYKDLVLSQLPFLNESQVLSEPLRRNTAPCIAYATFKIISKNPDANIIVAPSDHLIVKEDHFLNEIEKGLQFVSGKELLLRSEERRVGKECRSRW